MKDMGFKSKWDGKAIIWFLYNGLKGEKAEANRPVRRTVFRRGTMVVKIWVVVVQWMGSRYISQTYFIGLSIGLDVGVRESEGQRRALHFWHEQLLK